MDDRTPRKIVTVTLPDDDALFVRAQAIVAAHQDLPISELTPEDASVLRQISQRARRAARSHPNMEIEISPYVASLLRLED